MKKYAFIPARGGSKGLPRKNVKPFMGVPLIQRAINTAQETDLFHEVIVNSDDDEILSLARDQGATVLRRPTEMGSDSAEVDPLIIWSIEQLALDNLGSALFTLLYCTAPLRTAQDIISNVELVSSGKFDSALSLVETSDYLWEMRGGIFAPTNYDPKSRAARQEEDWNQFKENKAVYTFKAIDLISSGCRINGRVGASFMPADRSIDIDTLEEFHIAEAIAKVLG